MSPEPERTTRSFVAHGLKLVSNFPLDASAIEPSTAEPDVELVMVDALAPIDDSGDVILSHTFGNGETVRCTRQGDGSVAVEISDIARFEIAVGLDRVQVAPTDPVHREMAGILAQGWVMSMLLMMRGHTVLHATAVQVGNTCVALLADSGMGKSTTAAMLIRDGAVLVSDDVLRVDAQCVGGPVVHPGITALRLRTAATDLVSTLSRPDVVVAPTVDDRTLVSFVRRDSAPVPLDAILVPMPSRETLAPAIHWLEPAIATVELNRYPRVFDWHIGEPVRNHFDTSAAIAAAIPVGLLSVPWGPPWPNDVLDSILSLMPNER